MIDAYAIERKCRRRIPGGACAPTRRRPFTARKQPCRELRPTPRHHRKVVAKNVASVHALSQCNTGAMVGPARRRPPCRPLSGIRPLDALSQQSPRRLIDVVAPYSVSRSRKSLLAQGRPLLL